MSIEFRNASPEVVAFFDGIDVDNTSRIVLPTLALDVESIEDADGRVFVPERVCRNMSRYVNVFECSECGWTYDFVTDPYSGPRFCPSCGRKVVDDG